MNIKDRNECSLNDNNPETILHLFWNCARIFHFWRAPRKLEVIEMEFSCESIEAVCLEKED